MIDIADIVRFLIPATFRGVPFAMPDSNIEVGRRVQKFLFPGSDNRVWEDLGALDGPINISGVIIGDDYVTRTNAMRAACRTPGSAKLMHPWLGALTVVLARPAKFSFSQTHLRMALMEMTVEIYDPNNPAPPDTLTAIINSIQDVQNQVNGLIGAVMLPVNLTLMAIGAAEQIGSQIAGVFGSVVGAVGIIATAVAAPLADLGGIAALTIGVGYPAALEALLAGPAAAIAATSQTLAPQAIGPGDVAPPATPQDPRATTSILLAATVQIAALVGTGGGISPTTPLALAAASLAVSYAADAATDIVYTSQQDAQASLVQMLAAIDQVAALASSVAPFLPSTAGAVWRSLQGLRSAVIADISNQIGRLPVVQTLTLLDSTPAWLVAQALVGDNPAQVQAMYLDLVARNNLLFPQMMPPGPFEALVAA